MGAQLPGEALTHYDEITNHHSKLLILKAVRFRLRAPRHILYKCDKWSYFLVNQGLMTIFHGYLKHQKDT